MSDETYNIQQRFRFFLEHAGYCTPPGRAACALALARAEQWADEMEDSDQLYIHWEWDDEPYDPGDCCTTEEAQANFDSGQWTGPFGCIVETAAEADSDYANIYEAVWGIVVGPRGTNDPYCRVVRAELADQALYALNLERARRETAAWQDIATVQA